ATVVAGGAVGLVGGGAEAVRRVAGAGVVALVEGGAEDGGCPDANNGLAGVGLGAGIAIRGGAAVGLLLVRAEAVRRVTDAGIVALIERGADDGVCPEAGASLAGVALRAGVAVGAGRAVRLVRVGAHAARRVADTGIVALIEGGA